MSFRKGIKRSHLMLFYRRMASMAASGLSPSDAIKTLAEAGGKSALGRRVQSAHSEIKNGVPAGEVLRENFSHLGGLPDEIFDRESKECSLIYGTIADSIERESSLRNSFRGIMIYPAVVSAVLLVVLTVIVIFVLPVYTEMFEIFGSALPLPTQILLSSSDVLSVVLPILALGLIAAFVAFTVNRKLLYGFVDKIPVLGQANRQAAAAEFMEGFSMLARLGIPADKGFVAAANCISNDYLAVKLKGIAKQAADLKDLINKMEQADFFTDFIAQLLRTGEKSGTLETACAETAPAVFDEVEYLNRRFLGMATPLVMASLGVVVGFIIIALYLPIFQLLTLVS